MYRSCEGFAVGEGVDVPELGLEAGFELVLLPVSVFFSPLSPLSELALSLSFSFSSFSSFSFSFSLPFSFSSPYRALSFQSTPSCPPCQTRAQTPLRSTMLFSASTSRKSALCARSMGGKRMMHSLVSIRLTAKVSRPHRRV